MLSPVRFGDCELRRSERRLLIHGLPAPLGGRAFDVLNCLVEHRARPVPKDELLDAVWPAQDVEEGNLAVHVSALRKLLGPQAIATVPGQGYRFMLAIVGDAPSSPPVPGPAPAPVTGVAARSNLTPMPTRLIGRDTELADVVALLGEHRLVSLVGPGGIGKTRLALSAAWRRIEAGEGTLWWVDLAEAGDVAAVISRIGAALALPVDGSADPRRALLHGLQRLQARVVLDNCEHLCEAVARLVSEALSQAPGVRWLVTSQEPLKLAQEQVLRLGSLTMPKPGMPLQAALRTGALALLNERAEAADRRFRLADANLPAAIEICRQLDGIPLALEMAAARLPWMGAAQVQQLLDARLRLLTSAQRVATARQRTLQAAMAWSHALLSGTERRVLRRLAVFRGSFGLAEAADVASDPRLVGRWEAIDALGTLVDKSLVQVVGTAEAAAPRYRLLESTRLFALAHLLAVEEMPACKARHVQAYCRLARARMASLWVAPDIQWVAEIEPDIDNLHTALQYAIDLRDVNALSVLADPVGWWSSLTNSGAGLRRWIDALDELLKGSALPSRGRLQMLIGYAHRNIAPTQALPWLEQARACLEAGGDPVDLYRACAALATCYARVGRIDEAQDCLARVEALMQPGWPARLKLPGYDAAGFVAYFAGRSSDAEQAFRRFLEVAQGARIDLGVIAVSHNLADMALAAGRVDEAVRLGRELVERLRRMHHAYYLGFALGNLFAALVESGDLGSAAAAGSEALTLLRTEGNSLWLFDHFAALASRLGDARAVALCVGYCDAGRSSQGLSRDPTEAGVVDHLRQQLAASAAGADIARWLAEGAAMSGPTIDALVQALARQAAGGARGAASCRA